MKEIWIMKWWYLTSSPKSTLQEVVDKDIYLIQSMLVKHVGGDRSLT